MMDLNFSNDNGLWVAEFEATGDFNLHIERNDTGSLYLYQRTAGDLYDIVKDFGYNKAGDEIIDLDFTALVYPKYIKIKSAVKPTIAVVTFAQ